MSVRYAVLFKIHYWDAFIERRLRDLIRRVGSGDVYIFVDETNGPVGQIPHDRIIRATDQDMASLDLTLYPTGKVFWYNVDYPLYYFYSRNPSYDYYLMCEYDAVLNLDADDFVNRAATEQVDYVGFPIAHSPWPVRTIDGIYPKSFSVHQWLSCISLYSKRSVEFLLARRQAQGRSFKAGEIRDWPNNEVFVPIEMHNNGFVARSLSEFGKTDRYDWWPPSREEDLPSLQDQAFLHPVLDRPRYIISCVRFSDVRTYFSRDGQLRKLLAGESLASVSPALAREFVRRVVLKLLPGSILKILRPNRWAPNSTTAASAPATIVPNKR